MEQFVEVIISVDFLKWAIPLIGGVIAWLFNERRKRAWEEYVRKENNYKELLRTYRGFYTDSPNFDMQAEFLHQLNLCWLYCPDEVIKKAYALFDTDKVSGPNKNDIVEKTIGELVLSIRKDLLSRRVVRKTQLTSSDYRLQAPNPDKFNIK
jgi:Pyruvate/2-oxoacid:ferredoxin oxidoreductase delta subunit